MSEACLSTGAAPLPEGCPIPDADAKLSRPQNRQVHLVTCSPVEKLPGVPVIAVGTPWRRVMLITCSPVEKLPRVAIVTVDAGLSKRGEAHQDSGRQRDQTSIL